MRLSTEPDRDDERSLDVLRAALDSGVTLLDTADAYAWDDADTGHNERLIARALASWNGDRSRVTVATKGGLTRPDGDWVPDGRAKHLTAACEASCRALNVSRIALYQLHAPDPRTPLATSVRALAALQRAGVVERIGLCNVTVGQFEEARRIAKIDAVQVELSAWNDSNFLSGIAAHCVTHGVRLIASRPLGGTQRRSRSDPLLRDMAARHGATVENIALAWLTDLSEWIVTIPGATRVETARAIGQAGAIRLTDDDRAQLDARFTAAARVRRRPSPAGVSNARATPARDGEIVLIMGLPGAGKSTAARDWVQRGYARINRDAAGGSLKALVPVVERAIESGSSRLVLDNTYISRKSRAPIIQAAERIGIPVRCVWLQTSIDDAQVNAATRMVRNYGRLLDPDEMRTAIQTDVSAFGPGVQFRYQRELEPPDPSEGFAHVDAVPFERAFDRSFTNRALIVWCDGVLTDHPERDAVLRRYAGDGWMLFGLGWQARANDDAYAALKQRIGVPMEILYCPHGGGPPVCWCRKPLPGLGVVLIERHRLDPRRCVYVADGAQDPGFARKLAFEYHEASRFFAP